MNLVVLVVIGMVVAMAILILLALPHSIIFALLAAGVIVAITTIPTRG